MDSPGYARPAGRPPGQRTGSMPSPALPPYTEGFGGASQAPPPQRPAAKGPTTFAEMGIQGVKLEEKECHHVIFLFALSFLFFLPLVDLLVLICYDGLVFVS